jgi:hypothetical protein
LPSFIKFKCNARAPQRNPDVANRETNFVQIRSLHKQSLITFQVYLSQILDLYSFKPKTKYVEDLLDTDVSDDSSFSEEESDEYDDDQYVEDTIEATEEIIILFYINVKVS